MPPRKRIAVIAVHGVADQKPNESHRAIASMLAEHRGQGEDDRDRYHAFVSHELHLPQFPVIPPERTVAEDSRTHTLLQLRSKRDYIENTRTALAAGPEAAGTKAACPEPAGELGYQFMRMQLREHRADGGASTYVTTRLSSVRRAGRGPATRTETVAVDPQTGAAGAPRPAEHPVAEEREVDVYEVYWADLSRPAQGALGFVSTAYQLLLHVATLGRQAVDDTEVEYTTWPWRAIRWLQRMAVILLTLPIPLLNLVLLIVGFGVIPAGAIARRTGGPAIALCAVFAVAGMAAAYVLARRRVPGGPLRWSLLPFAGAALGALLGLGLWLSGIGPGAAISAAWWLMGGGIAFWIAAQYQRLRAGAVLNTMAIYAVAAATFAYWMRQRRGDADVILQLETSTLWTMQLIFAALRACWLALVIFSILLVLFWFVARWDARRDRRPGAEARWSRCRAALRTGRLAIGLSCASFLVFTLLAWAGIFSFTVARFEVFSNAEAETRARYPAVVEAFLPAPESIRRVDRELAWRALADTVRGLASEEVKGDRAKAKDDTRMLSVPEYFQGLIAASITPAAPIAAVPALAALLLLLWMAMPSVRAESGLTTECTNPESRRMGRWLSRGLDSTRWVTHLIYATLLIPVGYWILVALARVYGWSGVTALNWELRLHTYGAAGAAGTALATSAVFILGLLAKFGGSALDVVLDVDNYLRTTPAESTPRARICQRYVSVLRHVARPEQGYDGVVIVAHSLGALISGDLLRFLHFERVHGGDRALTPLGFGPAGTQGSIPITLFTMGNPVRQLLCRFFPHRYQWLRDNPDNGTQPLPRRSSEHPDADGKTLTPDPRQLGVHRWENAYRSGDYVGRALWLTEWYDRTSRQAGDGKYGTPLARATMEHDPVTVSEFCIGAGAHTHYWDMTAPDVADRIDAMIATACMPPHPRETLE